MEIFQEFIVFYKLVWYSYFSDVIIETDYYLLE